MKDWRFTAGSQLPMLAGRGCKLHISPLQIALISDDVALVCEQVQHAEFAVS